MPTTIKDTTNANHTIVPIPDKTSIILILIKIKGYTIRYIFVLALTVHAIAFAPRCLRR